MNRYKKELQKRGFKLENDFEYLPCNGIETVKAEITKEGIIYKQYHVGYGWDDILIPKKTVTAQ